MNQLVSSHTNTVNRAVQVHRQQRPQTRSVAMLRRRRGAKQANIITCMTTFVLLLVMVCIMRESDKCQPMIMIHAYPTGAGSCPGGVPAVGGSHIMTNSTDNSNTTGTTTTSNKLIQSSSLLENDFLVAINNTVVTTATAFNPSFYINTPYTLTVYNNRFLYTGILIRVEVPNTDTTSTNTSRSNFTFIPSTNTQYSFACVAQGLNVIGITHTNSTFKSLHSGILEIEEPTANVILDITVVGVNNDTVSLYAYDRLYINFIDPNAAPIETATSRPTTSPAAEVTAPTPVPTVFMAPSVTNTTTTTTETEPPTTAPSKLDTDMIASIPMKLRKNVNATTENENDGDNELTFTGENIQVQLSYILSSALTDGEIRAYERITSTWYNDFYNTNFYTVYNATTNRTDIIIIDVTETDPNTTTSSVGENTDRQLQNTSGELTLSNNYGIVLGSMMTSINVTNVTYSPYIADNESENADTNDTENATTKTNVQITYSQRITYRSSSATTSGSSQTLPNMQQQYLTIPYRSRIGRQLYIESLIESNIYTFSQLGDGDISSTSTLSVPSLVGPPPQTLTSNSTSTSDQGKEKFAKGYIAVITIGGLTVIAALFIVYHNNKYRLAPKVVADEEISTSVLLAEQRQQYADDLGSLRLHDSDISGADTSKNLPNGSASIDNREYIIYAPAGRLGIVLDDHTVLSKASKKDLKQFGPVISMIKEGSPLIDDSNMNVGDMIVAIDDIDVRNMTPQKVSKLINDRSKHPIRKITCIQIPNMIKNIDVPE